MNAAFQKNYATFMGGVISVQNPDPSTSKSTVVIQDSLIEDSSAVSGLQYG